MDLIEYYIELGFDIDAKNNKGNTPLHLAVLRDKAGIAFLLDKRKFFWLHIIACPKEIEMPHYKCKIWFHLIKSQYREEVKNYIATFAATVTIHQNT